jgi:SAM-dependent methyltransferase
MHPSAMSNGNFFFQNYSSYFAKDKSTVVVEIGSQDVNGSLKDVCPKEFKYIGVDFIKAKNVDVILDDPYKLPFGDGSVDIILTSSCFEHSEMFWVVYLEVLRILKPKGLFYMNVPSRGGYHLFPVDCWRFYPDSGIALSNWGARNGYNNLMLESYTQEDGGWGDFVAIYLKDASFADSFPSRILNSKRDFINGYKDSMPSKILNALPSNNGEERFLFDFRRLIPKHLRPIVKDFFRKKI